ncbi:disintegrin and metalloproteinase domain-containing protein 32 [Heterocephalus glaber]|uniref:Disintegrin and metalloproteinase domain-containing protein 32 n=1 Tax=Heterocephalus glaber TaxID=10181 RepID=A0AAX6R9G5_HETGA|nr:disintegrin and metalloproteinase domain-containing protein 32 [Heterocephalus glaber]
MPRPSLPPLPLWAPLLLLAWLRLGAAPSGPGSQNSFLQIILPEKLEGNTSDNSEDQISYIIPINEKPYTVHLKPRYFLGENFMVYLYNQGSVSSYSSDIQPQCYYQGYIQGHPSSFATLSICSGLRGILQFENVCYGIEPLESTVEFQHILYKLGNGTNELGPFKKNNRNIEKQPMDYTIFINEKAKSHAPDLFPLYLEMHIVVDKALYDYLGSDSMTITNKVIEMINLVNSLFTQLKVIVVLSSLEMWSDKNKISTVGEAHELLQKFLEWKKSYLTLRSHDVAYLFIYRDYPDYVGATFPGKMCVTHYSAGVTVYAKGITLEAFSVIFAQMLGLSLGIAYDDPTKCQCSETICIMNPEAIQSSGMKIFSNCSLNDFRSFISNVGARCLQNKPQMQRHPRPRCGNGRVEGNEVCDCGTEKQCGPQACCDHTRCVLKPESQCDTGPCCSQCQPFRYKCRPIQHPECDIPEYCNGSSHYCGPDIFVKNGHRCKNNSYICFEGDCHDLDARCESYFGKGSKNAPFACYAEVNAQVDSFGNCGRDHSNRYVLCGWRNLICGRLICTYPFRTPYIQQSISVTYIYVRDNVCVSLVNTSSPRGQDPFMVRSGAECDLGRVCVSGQCVESRMIKDASSACSAKCSGHGVCNSRDECNCTDGYLPPNCQTQSREWSGEEVLIITKASGKARKSWLLSFYICLPVLVIVTVIVTALYSLKKWFTKDEESLPSEYKSEGSTNTYVSRSTPEDSTQAYTSSN